MIGFDSIGTMGRLGNQMFQHAAVKGIARKHGYEYAIPPKDPSSQIDNYGLLDAFEMKGVDISSIVIMLCLHRRDSFIMMKS